MVTKEFNFRNVEFFLKHKKSVGRWCEIHDFRKFRDLESLYLSGQDRAVRSI